MWSSFGAAMERANQLAKQAQEAAEKLEKRLDESLLEGSVARGHNKAQAQISVSIEESNSSNQEISQDVEQENRIENDLEPSSDEIQFSDDGWSDHEDESLSDVDAMQHEEGPSQSELKLESISQYETISQLKTTQDYNTPVPSEDRESLTVSPDDDQHLTERPQQSCVESIPADLSHSLCRKVSPENHIPESIHQEPLKENCLVDCHELDITMTKITIPENHATNSHSAEESLSAEFKRQEPMQNLQQSQSLGLEDRGESNDEIEDYSLMAKIENETEGFSELSLESREDTRLSDLTDHSKDKLEANVNTNNLQFEDDLQKEEINNLRTKMDEYSRRVQNLEMQINERDDLLKSKDLELLSLVERHSKEIESLKVKLEATKDEAKKRVARAKERVDEMQKRVHEISTEKDLLLKNQAQAYQAELAREKSLVKAIREEGEALALKQSSMEQMVRSSRSEVRELSEELDSERRNNSKIAKELEETKQTVKSLRAQIEAARKEALAANNLENELLKYKETNQCLEAEKLSLEQQVKELENSLKDARDEVATAIRTASLESQQHKDTLSSYQSAMLRDLDEKLKRCEKEANLREDALRQEVSDLRKRWQDAVRRSDSKCFLSLIIILFKLMSVADVISYLHFPGLSLDIQECTAPLMRQIKAAERQARTKAAAWAEVESKLRSDLEQSVLAQQKARKDLADVKIKVSELELLIIQKEEQNSLLNQTVKSLQSDIDRLNKELDTIEREKDDWVQLQQNSDKDAANAKSDMLKSVIDEGERFRLQVSELKELYDSEKSKRLTLEDQIAKLLSTCDHTPEPEGSRQKESKRPELKAALNQADILQSMIKDLDESGGDYEDVLHEQNETESDNESEGLGRAHGLDGSYAAMEQLSLRLKSAFGELKMVKKQLTDTEQSRKLLLEELVDLRQLSEKLPLFETKISELMLEQREKDLEVQGLREGMQEMRAMYREQLDSLLEEKAALIPVNSSPGKSLQELERQFQAEMAETYTLSSEAAALDLPFGG